MMGTLRIWFGRPKHSEGLQWKTSRGLHLNDFNPHFCETFPDTRVGRGYEVWVDPVQDLQETRDWRTLEVRWGVGWAWCVIPGEHNWEVNSFSYSFNFPFSSACSSSGAGNSFKAAKQVSSAALSGSNVYRWGWRPGRVGDFQHSVSLEPIFLCSETHLTFKEINLCRCGAVVFKYVFTENNL